MEQVKEGLDLILLVNYALQATIAVQLEVLHALQQLQVTTHMKEQLHKLLV